MVVDDEPLAVGLLTKHIQQFSQLNLVASCWNAIEAFEIINQEHIDLIFLDIQMPGMTGIDFVKSLQHRPNIIFTTAYRDYAVESYDLDVIDYRLKPITIDRFLKSINKYFNKIAATQNANKSTTPGTESNLFLFVNTNRRFEKVVLAEVLYIESLKDYVKITFSQKSILTKAKISAFEKLLPSFFIRVHRSFIVNTNNITGFTKHDIEINELEIPIGISYKKEVLAFLQQ